MAKKGENYITRVKHVSHHLKSFFAFFCHQVVWEQECCSILSMSNAEKFGNAKIYIVTTHNDQQPLVSFPRSTHRKFFCLESKLMMQKKVAWVHDLVPLCQHPVFVDILVD